ncbi:MAG: tetratricopeptide repeat protein [Armatimonadota bacterium]
MGDAGGVMMGVCIAVFLMIIAGLLFHKILGSYIEGAMTSMQFIITGSLFLLIAVMVLLVPSIPVKLILFLVIIAGFILAPNISGYFNKKETETYYDERIERYKSAIEQDPGNLAARSFLVDTLSKEGRYDEAIDAQTELLNLAPQNTEEIRKLNLLIEYREENISGIIICPHCGFRNQAGRKICQNCENQLSFTDDLRKRLAEGGAKRITIFASISIGVLALVIYATNGITSYARIFIIFILLSIIILSQVMFFYRKSQ